MPGLLLVILFSAQLNKAEEIPRLGESGVEPPVFTKRVYPDLSGEKISVSGYIIIEFVCRINGEITDIKILRGLKNKKIAQKFVEALEQWEFSPGKRNGLAADIRMTVKSEILLQ